MRKLTNQDPPSYAPIAMSLNDLSEEEMAKLHVKFDIAHFIASEKLPFSKCPALCKLEAHHGGKIDNAYTNRKACTEFCHYIAETRREELSKMLAAAKFFSLVMDGSTDKGNIQYTSDTRYKACVIFTHVCTRRQTHLYTEANTCLYIVKWVYTRR